MAEKTVFQNVQFGVVSLNDPDFEDVMSDWYGLEDPLELIPEDALTRMREDNAYVLHNKATGEIGVITEESLALNYEHVDAEFVAVGDSVISKIVSAISDIDIEEASGEYIQGVNAVMQVIISVQEGTYGKV